MTDQARINQRVRQAVTVELAKMLGEQVSLALGQVSLLTMRDAIEAARPRPRRRVEYDEQGRMVAIIDEASTDVG